MGDSDDEYDRRRARDKFRRERSDYQERRGEDRGRREDYVESRRDMWSRDRGRRDYREVDLRRRERYTPPRHDMSPPMKKMRREWDDRGYSAYEGGGYGTSSMMSGGHQSWGNVGGDVGAVPHVPHSYGGAVGGGGGHRQPQMMTFKQFLASQDDGIGDEEAVKKYNDYKLDFRRQQLNEFFLAHKEEEWFKSKFQPEECAKRRQEQLASLAKRKKVFLDLMELGWLENISLDSDKSDELIRLLDAVNRILTAEQRQDYDSTTRSSIDELWRGIEETRTAIEDIRLEVVSILDEREREDLDRADKNARLIESLHAKVDALCEQINDDRENAIVADETRSSVIDVRDEMVAMLEQLQVGDGTGRPTVSDRLIEQLQRKVDAQSAQISQLQAEFNQQNLENRRCNCDVAFREMRRKIDKLESYSRINNLEVHNVPFSSGEKLVELLGAVARELRVPFDGNDVVAASRIFHGNVPKYIVFELRTRFLRDIWLVAAKRRRHLDAACIDPAFPSRQVQITRNDTPLTNTILRSAEVVRRQHGFHEVYCDDGRVFLQERAGGDCIHIRDMEDLEVYRTKK